MSTNVGWATLTIIPSMQGFSTALAKQINGPLAAAGAAGGTTAGNGFASAFKSIALTAVVAGATHAIGGLVKESVQAASDLEQSFGSVKAIFADSASQIQQWSSAASSSVGLTKAKYNELATLLGAQLRNTGTPMDQLAGKTNMLIELGADLAATYNTTVEEAVRAISATFRGERDPIEKYGVTLRQAEIDAKAAAMGYEKVGNKMTAEGNAAGTLAILLEQTNVAHGQFAREADTYAVKLQKLKSGWGDLKAAIGELFMPVLKRLFDGLNSVIQPMARLANAMADARNQGENMRMTFRDIANVFKDTPLAPHIKEIASRLTPLAPLVERVRDAFAPLGPALNKVRDALPGVNLPFGTLLDLIVAIAPHLALVAEKIAGELLSGVKALYEPLNRMFTAISDAMQGSLPGFRETIEVLANIFGTLVGVFVTIVNVIADVGAALAEGLAPVFESFMNDVLPPLLRGFDNLLQLISPIAEFIGDTLVYAIETLSPLLQRFTDEHLAPLATKFEEVTAAGGPVGDALQNILGFATDCLQPVIDLAGAMGGTFLDCLSALEEPLSRITTALGESFQDALPTIQQFIEDICRVIEEDLLPIIEPLVAWIGDIAATAAEVMAPVMADLGESLLPALSAAFEGLSEALGPVIEALCETLGPFLVTLLPIIGNVIRVVGEFAAALIYFVTGAIQIVVAALTGDWMLGIKGFNNITKGAKQFQETEWLDTQSIVEGAVSVMGSNIGSDWASSMGGMSGTTGENTGKMKQFTEDDIGALKEFMANTGHTSASDWGVCMNDMSEDTRTSTDQIAGYASEMPNDVRSGLGDTKQTLKPSGSNMIEGFLAGIQLGAEKVNPILGKVMEMIRKWFPSSPAKRGPFSGKGYTTFSGEKMIRDWALGMESAAPTVDRALRAVTGSASTVLAGGSLIGNLATNLGSATDSRAWSNMGRTVSDGVNAVAATVSTGMTEINTNWDTSWDGMATSLSEDWATMQLNTDTSMAHVQATANQTLLNVGTAMNASLPVIRDTWNITWGTMASTTATNLQLINENVTGGMTYMTNTVYTMMNDLGYFWLVRWNQMWVNQCNVWKLTQENVNGGMVYMYTTIRDHMGAIQGTWTNGWNAVHNVVANAWNAATAACRTGMQNVITVISELPRNIRGAIGNVGDILKGSGESMMNGFIEGIRAAGKRVGTAIETGLSGATPYANHGSVMAESIVESLQAVSPLVANAARSVAADTYEAMAVNAPTIAAPQIENGGVIGTLATNRGAVREAPIVENLTLQSHGNIRDDLNETMFQLRRIQRGGAHA